MQRARTYSWETSSRLKSIDDSRTGKMNFGHDALGNLSWAAKDDLSPVLRMPDAVCNLFKTVEKMTGNTDLQHSYSNQEVPSTNAMQKAT